MTENKRTTLYSVNYGHMNEPQVYSVYSDKEIAQKFIDLFPEDVSIQQLWIEDIKLDAHVTALLVGAKPYTVYVSESGSVERVEPSNLPNIVYYEVGEFTRMMRGYMIVIFTSNAAFAAKVVNEKIQLLRENGKWGAEIL